MRDESGVVGQVGFVPVFMESHVYFLSTFSFYLSVFPCCTLFTVFLLLKIAQIVEILETFKKYILKGVVGNLLLYGNNTQLWKVP